MAQGSGRAAAAPETVWEAVKADYLAGLSGPDCCRRHGVKLSALRDRAARHGWRRADQPWTPPHALDPWDEGLALEEATEGDLDRLDWEELAHVAESRMMRAVLRGDAGEVMRWDRVTTILDQRAAEVNRWAQQEEVRAWHARNRAEAAAAKTDSPDDPDSVSESGVEDQAGQVSGSVPRTSPAR